jgi:hypothetical protein
MADGADGIVESDGNRARGARREAEEFRHPIDAVSPRLRRDKELMVEG